MKTIIKELPSSKKKSFPFIELSDGMIQCQGIILKRLNRRITNKNIIFEYYKCQNSYPKHKQTKSCKFSGKLVYEADSRPNHLVVIKKHSLNCLSSDFSNKFQFKKFKLENTGKVPISLPYSHFIYNERIMPASISVQIQNENANKSTDNYIACKEEGFIKVNEED